MSKSSRPRRGSLQYWPRKRARKAIPSVNFKPIKTSEKGILGFITYKVGMATAVVKDLTDKSMTQNKSIAVPITILEVPNMKIFSVRFYKYSKVLKDVVVSNDKELKRKLKVPKQVKSLDKDAPKDYDDIKLICYSLPNSINLKKTPDLIELAVSADDKLTLVKSLVGKEITLENFAKSDLLDARGLTKGKGFQGPVKRFGVKLRFHKTEKGRRKVGSIGPWHPARVTFQTPAAGQLGMFSRVTNNLKNLGHNSIKEKDINPVAGFKNYGRIKSNYILVKGSVQGPAKRQILITPSYRPTKLKLKRKFELQEVLT